MRVKLEKLIDGEWYVEGVYTTAESLANACWFLGRYGSVVEQLRVTEVAEDENG